MAEPAEMPGFYELSVAARCIPLDFLPNALVEHDLLTGEDALGGRFDSVWDEHVEYSLTWLDVSVWDDLVVLQVSQPHRLDAVFDLLLGMTQWGSGDDRAMTGVHTVTLTRSAFFARESGPDAAAELLSTVAPRIGEGLAGLDSIVLRLHPGVADVTTARLRLEPSRRDGAWLEADVELEWRTEAATAGDHNGLDAPKISAVQLLSRAHRGWPDGIHWADSLIMSVVEPILQGEM